MFWIETTNRYMKRGVAILVLNMDLCTAVEEGLNDYFTALTSCAKKRGIAVVWKIDWFSSVQKQLNVVTCQ